ncbi:MAG: hypothetical protein MSG64_15695 [Pyrinomonadaceae bacterium MAG19_C2-C3]|nr:hypothetical protein [Pyrinomonadaceae bacterium MAG19_C2-C3]
MLREITIGEEVSLTRAAAGYMQADGWQLKFYARGQGKGFTLELGQTESGVWSGVITSAVTSEMSEGVYYWQLWAENGSVKHQLASGRFPARTGLQTIAETVTVDGRTQNERILDAINATLEGRAVKDVAQYQIGNRALTKIPVTELLNLKKHYGALVARDRRRGRMRAGGSYFKSILTSFERP